MKLSQKVLHHVFFLRHSVFKPLFATHFRNASW